MQQKDKTKIIIAVVLLLAAAVVAFISLSGGGGGRTNQPEQPVAEPIDEPAGGRMLAPGAGGE